MTEVKVTIPEMIFIAATRVALGAGIGLLVSFKLSRHQRKSTGLALAAVGAATTIPFVMRMRSRRQSERLHAA